MFLGEMAQIIAETITKKVQIPAVKSIFLHAAKRYVNETLYLVLLNTALGKPQKVIF